MPSPTSSFRYESIRALRLLHFHNCPYQCARMAEGGGGFTEPWDDNKHHPAVADARYSEVFVDRRTGERHYV